MSPTKKRTKAMAGGIAGAALLLALGVAAAAHVGETGAGTSASVVPVSAPGTGEPAAQATEAPGATQAPSDTTPPTAPPAAAAAPTAKATVPPTVATRRSPAPSTTAAPAAPTTTPPAAAAAAPAPAKPTPGQRLEFTSAGVQAAMAALHQRIPLFAPTEAQLRTFADAVCTSFDQGQTQAQVGATVRQAVSHIQGASLSAADADFAVRTVVQLRCPGHLP